MANVGKSKNAKRSRRQVGDGTGHTYMLENVPDPLWNRFNDRCRDNGQKIRFVMLQAISEFLEREEQKKKGNQ